MDPSEVERAKILKLAKAIVTVCNSTPLIPIEFTFDIDESITFEKNEKVLLVMNHGGAVAFESLLLYGMLYAFSEERAFDLVFEPGLFISANDVKANMDKHNDADGASVFIIFPEGAPAVCKSGFTKGYETFEFKRGFLHLAKQQKRNILVGSVVGQEEAFPSLGKFNITAFGESLDLPCPIPYPFLLLLGNAYQIKIHEKVRHEDVEPTKECAEEFRQKIQRELDVASESYPLRMCSRLFENIDTVFNFSFSM